MIVLGIDFDNTIVSYDTAFYRAAVKKGFIPHDFSQNKTAIRNFLRANKKEDEWTLLQGEVYGPSIFDATPYLGVFEFLKYLSHLDIPIFIISHKTKTPYKGPPYNLHYFAEEWLNQNEFINAEESFLKREDIFFESTIDAKYNRIRKQNCTHFIDDLPEFLLGQAFPDQVIPILFDPHHQYRSRKNY